MKLILDEILVVLITMFAPSYAKITHPYAYSLLETCKIKKKCNNVCLIMNIAIRKESNLLNPCIIPF